MKKYLNLISAFMVMSMLLTGCSSSNSEATEDGDSTSEQTTEGGETVVNPAVSTDTLAITHTGVMTIDGLGDIGFELYGNNAPQTVANFVKLAESGFYNGLTFHRVLSGTFIHGGSPNGDNTGGSGSTIIGEFAENDIPNALSHTRGVMTMSRLPDDFNSGSSQFLIMHGDTTYLDGQYAGFGKVTTGMTVIDAIANVATSNDKPIEDVVITSIVIH